jgi:hypothetical protein
LLLLFQKDLKFFPSLDSDHNPPIFTSWVAGITGVHTTMSGWHFLTCYFYPIWCRWENQITYLGTVSKLETTDSYAMRTKCQEALQAHLCIISAFPEPSECGWLGPFRRQGTQA